MADVVREGHGIDPCLRELAVIMTCQTIGGRYEHDRHWNMALNLGVPKEKLEKIWDFEASHEFSALEKVVLRLARDATRAPDQVNVATWQEVCDALGDRRALALLFSIGWYNLTARISGVLQVKDESDFKRL